MSPLPHLFSPLKIGRLEIANRVMMPGMSAGMMLANGGEPTDEMIAYYVERAKARPGLMAIGASQVMPPTGRHVAPLALFDDRVIPALGRLVDAVHAHGVPFGIQLWDGGTQAGGSVHLSPSGISTLAAAVYDQRNSPELRTLTTTEIADVITHFAAGARRCKAAGFDFVEIHAGHGYLISAFLSSFFNRRTDAYGGSLENRARILVEMIGAIRREVGADFPVGVKINGEDYLAQGGWGIADACAVAPLLEAAGAAYLSITAGVMGAARLTVPPMYEPQGCFTDLAAAVKKTVRIPVATIGRIKDPQMAEALVAGGEADIVCMGRAMIADPELVEKARRGDLADIRKCLADCRGCIDQEMRSIKRGAPGQASCVVNPRMQRESVLIDVEGSARAAPRRVLVIGGGLAGLEAARRCAFSGHRVTLCESRDRLGGQILYAAKVPGRAEIADMLPWYERQLGKYGVEVRLDTTVDAALLSALAPEVVFIATGSVAQVPESLHALATGLYDVALLMGDEVFEPDAPVGRNVLVIGGDQVGMQIADYLSEVEGRTVTVAEAHGHFAAKLAANDRWYLIRRVSEKRVRRFKNVHDIVPGANGTLLLRTEGGEETLAGVDTVVFASERRSVRALADAARALGLETHVVGDAADVQTEDAGTIFANIAQAYDLARRI